MRAERAAIRSSPDPLLIIEGSTATVHVSRGGQVRVSPAPRGGVGLATGFHRG